MPPPRARAPAFFRMARAEGCGGGLGAAFEFEREAMGEEGEGCCCRPCVVFRREEGPVPGSEFEEAFEEDFEEESVEESAESSPLGGRTEVAGEACTWVVSYGG